MDQDFDTMQLPDAPDAVAPDGSDVRVLLRLGRGSMFRDTSEVPRPDAGLRRRIAFAARRRWACNQGTGLFGGR